MCVGLLNHGLLNNLHRPRRNILSIRHLTILGHHIFGAHEVVFGVLVSLLHEVVLRVKVLDVLELRAFCPLQSLGSLSRQLGVERDLGTRLGLLGMPVSNILD